MAATEFTPLASALGGALIGLSAVILMAFSGRIAGISGIIGRVLNPIREGEPLQALAFLVGLIAAPLVYLALVSGPIEQSVSDSGPLMIAGGLLVGFGSILGGGCTSGHGVCGLSRLSLRSLAATLTFMATGFITVFVARHVLGG